MVLAAAMKAYKKAEGLRERLQSSKDLLVDNEAWALQQELVGSYRRVLLLDLEYALDKKVEQDLWSSAFKNLIIILQGVAKDKKHPKRAEGQAMLTWCLEAAAGFYLCLLHEICAAFDLDLPFRRNGFLLGAVSPSTQPFTKEAIPNKSSLHYISQHCLVHLGDIARYRNQNRQAETFYKYGAKLSPTSGQPYNQLAILEASRGDKLSAVFHYVRAVAVSHPFPAAATNLARVFDKHADETVRMEGNAKLPSHEYLAAFLKMHGLLYSHAELDKAEKLVNMLTSSLTPHIATESLSAWKLVQMLIINLYGLRRVIGGEDANANDSDLTGTEKQVKSLLLHFLAGCLNAFLLPVYTMDLGETLLQYFAMPAIKLTLDWMRLDGSVVQSEAFTSRRQIWPSLCRLLNLLQPTVSKFALKKYDHVPLPEDRDLQGFSPFEKTFKYLDFQTEVLRSDTVMLNKLRAARMIEIGSWLAGLSPSVMTVRKEKEGELVFEAVSRPDPPADLIKELEDLSVGKSVIESAPPTVSTASEKKGILKSEVVVDKSGEGKVGTVIKTSRNVALTAIFNQKLNDDTKQVTFRTPSPPDKNQKKTTTKKADSILKNKEPAKVSPPQKASRLSEEMKQEQTEQKQMVLSALFDDTKSNPNKSATQPMSGLLNLNKQQQELLSSSKVRPQTSNRQMPTQGLNRGLGQQRVVEKMEAARKEYEDAMSVLQQQQQRPLEPPSMMGFSGLPHTVPHPGSGMESMFGHGHPPGVFMMGVPPPQPPMAMHPPPMGMHMPTQPSHFALKILPWQHSEPPQLPMPPSSWWTDHPPPPPPPSIGMHDNRGPQPLTTYSLFSNPLNPQENDPNNTPRLLNQQSFWSGPGPSPLERLLEQQRKQMQ